MQGELEIVNKTKGKLPSLPFRDLKRDILGDDYNLSVAYVSKAKMRELNNTHRQKDKATNVLSFALSKSSGELILCPDVIKKELEIFDRNFRELLGFLVIHGMLHLKGMQHSSKMEREEKKYDQKYFHRSGHRVHDDQNRSRRIRKGRTKS